MPVNALLLLSSDSGAARVDFQSLSEQSLLELLVENMKCKFEFQNDEGDFYAAEEWLGVTFADSNVTKVHWESEAGVYGFLEEPNERMTPGGSIDFQWFPAAVESIIITFMELEGGIATEVLPRGLLFLDCSRNKFSGSFALETLPPNINSVYAPGNALSGDIDLEKIPDSLHHLSLEGNSVTGGVRFSLTSQIYFCFLHNNKLTGPVDLVHMPGTLQKLTLHGNNIRQQELILGKLPGELVSLRLGLVQFDAVLNADGTPCMSDAIR